MSSENLIVADSISHTGLSRRRALQTVSLGLGVGYSLAAAPLAAQTAIKTSSEGLNVGMVTIDINGVKLSAYRAAPAGKTNLPVVLVIQEIFGLHEYITDVANRFAQQGYMAIAPDLFERQGDPVQYAEMAKLIAEVVSKVPDEQVIKDLDATVAWVGKNGGDTSRVAITGFCWGGRITWLYAAHAKIKAGVAWYGRLVGASNAMNPSHPIDKVAQLNAPVLGLYGGKDTGIPLDTVEKMKLALANGSPAAKQAEFVIYPDAPHAFHADYRPSYREEAAKDGFAKCLAWFKKHGV